jgi:hypothetical protein
MAVGYYRYRHNNATVYQCQIAQSRLGRVHMSFDVLDHRTAGRSPSIHPQIQHTKVRKSFRLGAFDALRKPHGGSDGS